MGTTTRTSDFQVYRIRVKGHVDPAWAAWLSDMTIHNEGVGETVLTGAVRDQAALHGLLAKIRDLGLTLLGLCLVDDVTNL